MLMDDGENDSILSIPVNISLKCNCSLALVTVVYRVTSHHVGKDFPKDGLSRLSDS